MLNLAITKQHLLQDALSVELLRLMAAVIELPQDARPAVHVGPLRQLPEGSQGVGGGCAPCGR